MEEKLKKEYRDTLVTYKRFADMLDKFNFKKDEEPEEGYLYKSMVAYIKKLSELETEMLKLNIDYQYIHKEVLLDE